MLLQNVAHPSDKKKQISKRALVKWDKVEYLNVPE